MQPNLEKLEQLITKVSTGKFCARIGGRLDELLSVAHQLRIMGKCRIPQIRVCIHRKRLYVWTDDFVPGSTVFKSQVRRKKKGQGHSQIIGFYWPPEPDEDEGEDAKRTVCIRCASVEDLECAKRENIIWRGDDRYTCDECKEPLTVSLAEVKAENLRYWRAWYDRCG